MVFVGIEEILSYRRECGLHPKSSHWRRQKDMLAKQVLADKKHRLCWYYRRQLRHRSVEVLSSPTIDRERVLTKSGCGNCPIHCFVRSYYTNCLLRYLILFKWNNCVVWSHVKIVSYFINKMLFSTKSSVLLQVS